MNMKFIKIIFICILCLILVFPLSSCREEKREVVFRVSGDYIQWRYSDTELWSDLISISDLNENGALNGKSAYEIAVSQGFEGSEKEWLESLVGAKGEDGVNGQDGQSVYIGENGNWWIGDTDTGISVLSQSGESIYAVPNFVGMTLSEIQQMPKAQNFVLLYYGDASVGVVASQSIPAGVVALEGTQIKIYMSNYLEDGEEDPTEIPTRLPSEAPTEGPTSNPAEQPTAKPTESLSEPPASTIQLKSITSPIQKGQKATVEIIGKPNTEYTISVYYSSGPSKAQGLESKFSDENGCVSWTWTVGASTSTGEKKIVVSDGTSSIEFNINIIEKPQA